MLFIDTCIWNRTLISLVSVLWGNCIHLLCLKRIFPVSLQCSIDNVLKIYNGLDKQRDTIPVKLCN